MPDRPLRLVLAILMALGVGMIAGPRLAAAATVKLVALGDSITAGLGLRAEDAYPSVLQGLLKAAGEDVEIANAGVSGDTVADGLDRLDWSVPEGTQGVILALGANDMLRGLNPAVTRKGMEAILSHLQERKIAVLIVGMRASSELGSAYRGEFDPIFPELAARHGMLLQPFLLDGVALDPALNQPDGLHPNAKGAHVIAERLLPEVRDLIAQIRGG